MQQQKKFCFCFTARRLVFAVLLTTSLANLFITGAVLGAGDTPTSTVPPPSATPHMELGPYLTLTGVVPTATEFATLAPKITEPATLTATATMTDTSTPSPTQTPSSTPVSCVKKANWPYIYVQANDTLYSLAVVTGSTINELMLANCLTDTRIYIKQQLYVPRLPVPSNTPTTTSVPTHFKDPYGAISTCNRPPFFSFSVLPIDPEGIKSLLVSYNVDGGPSTTLSMQADGPTYYASGYLSEKEFNAQTLYFYFVAVDGRGNYEYSLEYKVTASPCPKG